MSTITIQKSKAAGPETSQQTIARLQRECNRLAATIRSQDVQIARLKKSRGAVASDGSQARAQSPDLARLQAANSVQAVTIKAQAAEIQQLKQQSAEQAERIKSLLPAATASGKGKQSFSAAIRMRGRRGR